MAREPFSFTRETDRLEGWIELPDGPGPHPAVIFVHGSGRSDVQSWDDDELRARLRCAGVAVAVWDKPGCGRSSGTFEDDLRGRASEVIGAVDALRSRGDIDHRRIGLWGISQGGWVGPMAAIRCADIAYAILVSGPAHRWDTQGRYLLRENLRLEGDPPERVEAVVRAMDQLWALAMAGASYEQTIAPLAPFAEHPFLKSIGWATPTRESYGAFFSGSVDVDASSILEHVTCPVLALFGELDSQVDWRESVAAYRKALARNPDVTIRSFPGADHCLLRSETGSLREMRRHWQEKTARPIDGYVDAILGWLSARGFARAEAKAQAGG